MPDHGPPRAGLRLASSDLPLVHVLLFVDWMGSGAHGANVGSGVCCAIGAGRPKALASSTLPSYSRSSGTVSMSIVTGATPGSSAASTGHPRDAYRRLALSCAGGTTPHPVIARTPTGTWNSTPTEAIVIAATP